MKPENANQSLELRPIRAWPILNWKYCWQVRLTWRIDVGPKHFSAQRNLACSLEFRVMGFPSRTFGSTLCLLLRLIALALVAFLGVPALSAQTRPTAQSLLSQMTVLESGYQEMGGRA